MGDANGLYLVVQPTGGKLWRMNYWFLGQRKTAHFGVWPIVSLADARERRDVAKRQLSHELDPADEQRKARLQAKVAHANTFKAVVEEWLERTGREGRAIDRSARTSAATRSGAHVLILFDG